MKLSPCKHCGSPAHLVKNITDPHMCWSVSCSNLDCGIATRAFSQQQQAVDAWQRCKGVSTEYVISRDNEGHWYIVALEDIEAFRRQCDLASADSEEFNDFDGLDIERTNGSPSQVVFTWHRVQ